MNPILMTKFIFPRLHLLTQGLWASLILLLSFVPAFASHNLAGEITYNYLGNNTIEITLTTYTDPSAYGVDRCEIDLEIWNATGSVKVADLTQIRRVNGPYQNDPLYPTLNCPNAYMGEYIFGSVKKNVYKINYTFNGPGFYLIRFYDHARLANIANMFDSGLQTFFLETTVFINNFLGPENSPRFLNHPLDFACVDRIWTHNPGGWDPDNGDSLVYTLVECRQYDPPSIPNPIPSTGYTFPDNPIHGISSFSMDSRTGLITWDAPRQIGIYNIAYKVEEYRNGIFIGVAFRDMAIWVRACDNEPPVIETIEDTCVYAGDTLQFDITSYDPDFYVDSLYFGLNNAGQGFNGPFAVPISPATITFVNQGLNPTLPIDTIDTVKATVTWVVDCSNIRSQFYQIDLYAHDNFSYLSLFGTGGGNSQMLSTHKVVTINVVPRPVTGLLGQAQGGSIILNWDPHYCSNATGYEIYRRIGASGWQQDTICCDMTPDQAGYTLVGTTTGHGSTTFSDNTVGEGQIGMEICYVVVALFDDGVRSCASNEFCIQIDKFRPALTNASVTVTSTTVGEMYVSWAQPDPDTTGFFVQPFTYNLFRAQDINGPANWVTLATGILWNDTNYTDTGLNTDAQGYRYRIEVRDANGTLVAEGNEGSSVYLTLTPGDEKISLQWSEFVPWTNEMYYIFRADAFGGPWSLIDSVVSTGRSLNAYLDTGLVNFKEYCYYVESKGGYPAQDIKYPLINDSEIRCASPTDLTPPCIDPLAYDTLSDCSLFLVGINWTDPDSLCGGDLAYHTIYLADKEGDPFTAIAQVPAGQNLFNFTSSAFFPNQPPSIAHCFGITATDTLGNESEMLTWCFDNCPTYEISNVFTPNGDGINDHFGIFLNRAIKIKNALIYDRWGSVVFSTQTVTDPRQIWDGNNNRGQRLSEGVYYYYIEFDEDRIVGDFPRPPIVGWVTLMR